MYRRRREQEQGRESALRAAAGTGVWLSALVGVGLMALLRGCPLWPWPPGPEPPGPVVPQVERFELPQGAVPSGLSWDGATFWVGGEGNVLYRVSVRGQVLGTVPGPGLLPWALAWDGAALWVADAAEPFIYRVSPEDGEILNAFPAPEGYFVGDLAWGPNGLWALTLEDRRLRRLETQTGRTVAVLSVPGFPVGVGWDPDGERFWVLDAAAGALIALDAQGRERARRGLPGPGAVPSDPRGVAVIAGALWLADGGEKAVYKLLDLGGPEPGR